LPTRGADGKSAEFELGNHRSVVAGDWFFFFCAIHAVVSMALEERNSEFLSPHCLTQKMVEGECDSARENRAALRRTEEDALNIRQSIKNCVLSAVARDGCVSAA